MKIIIYLSVILFTQNLFSQEEIKLNILIQLGIAEFIQEIETIKTKKNITQASEFEFSLRPYFKHKNIWEKFDTQEYKSLWGDKFNTAFSKSERKQINLKLNNIFLRKVLNEITFKVDFFEFYNRLKIIEDYDQFVRVGYKQECEKLIKLVYLDIFKDYVRPLLDQYQSADGQALTYNLFTSNSTLLNWNQIEKRKSELDDFLMRFYQSSWKKLSVTELREFNRQLVVDPLLKKFTILFVNYHYLYLLQFTEKQFQSLKIAP